MKAHELKGAFDSAFARAPEEESGATVRLLAIRIGGEAHALRLAEIAGVFVDRTITPVPSRSPALLGIAGVRGAVVPVFDLGALVGYEGAAPRVRWLVIAARERVGFAFDAFEGHLAVAATAIVRAREGSSHVREVARSGDQLRPIVLLESVIAALGRKEA
ncbi:MAG: chemotaxis protein CheW [Kofleriaceae bacterium]|nr:chemotaxis protein CheW [Kofleriaceae bacterium]